MKKHVCLIFTILLLLVTMIACGSKEINAKPKQDDAPSKALNLNTEGLPKEYVKFVETAVLYAKGELEDDDKEIKTTGISWRFGHSFVPDDYDFGYALMDINEDGIDELLLADMDTSYIYNIYTIKDGKALLVASTDGRDDYSIAEDGTIHFSGYYHDGAIEVDAFYDFDGEKLKFKEAISSHLVSGSICNYRVFEENFFDESNAVSNDEYLDLMDKYPSKNIEFTSFIKKDLNQK